VASSWTIFLSTGRLGVEVEVGRSARGRADGQTFQAVAPARLGGDDLHLEQAVEERRVPELVLCRVVELTGKRFCRRGQAQDAEVSPAAAGRSSPLLMTRPRPSASPCRRRAPGRRPRRRRPRRLRSSTGAFLSLGPGGLARRSGCLSPTRRIGRERSEHLVFQGGSVRRIAHHVAAARSLAVVDWRAGTLRRRCI